jgi:hypothetical protein
MSLVRLLPLIAFILFSPTKALCAIAIDNITTQGNSGAGFTFDHAVAGTNRLLLVSASIRQGDTVTAATFAGQPLTFLGGQNNDSNPLTRIEMWYLVNPPAGTNPVSITLSANSTSITTATSLTGVNQVVPFLLVGASAFQSAASTGGGDSAPVLTVTSTPGDLVLDSVTTQGDVVSLVQGPLQSLRWTQFNGTTPAGAAQGGSSAAGASSVALSWTLGAPSRWSIGAVSVRPAVDISGRVFEDANFAGTAAEYDGGTGDLGLPNVDVELYDSSTNAYITSVTTTAGGTYSFTGLSNGTYKVRVRSATIGDADTPPRGGLNGTVPGTWPYPLPEMTWANGAPLYGGVSPNTDDTATGDNGGPGDTYATITVNSSNLPNVNFGFAYNLIVHTTDDNRGTGTRSTQGSLRQFIKNANSIGSAGGTTANTSQFRMMVPPNQSSGADAWWRITAANLDLPALADGNTLLDGSTQRLNSGTNSNSRGPEIEITGAGTFGTSIGLTCSGAGITLREFVITTFSLNGIRIDGANNRVEGCYVGTDATGTTSRGIGEDGILVNGNNNTIGGTNAAQRNVLSGNADEGLDINPGASNNVVIGNYVGTNATATAIIGNGGGATMGGIIVQGNNNRIGGSTPGEGNVIAGNNDSGIRIADGAIGNVVHGNFIGTNASGATTFGNAFYGIIIELNANATIIGGTAAGEANVIAYNGGPGVFVTDFLSDRNRISGNSIYGNGGLGIDLSPLGVGSGGGANNNKARPVITSIVASGADQTMTVTAAAGDTIEFFRANNAASPVVGADPSGSGEGYLYLGSCVDNDACSGPHISAVADANPAAGTVQATLLASGVAGSDSVTATATDAVNGTSEFSANAVTAIALTLVKQAWLEGGSTPLASPLTAPAGSSVVFLIYVRNTATSTVSDVRISDLLDEAAFAYVPGSMVRTSAASPPTDTATELQIFNATAPGTGTPLSDTLDGDAASALDTNANTAVDRITAGAVAGQANSSLSIGSHATFGVRFKVVLQ